MNFSFMEKSEQQKFFYQKGIFEKQSSQIETEKEKKNLLGGKFESFQNQDLIYVHKAGLYIFTFNFLF